MSGINVANIPTFKKKEGIFGEEESSSDSQFENKEHERF